jgi:hypothetical protein
MKIERKITILRSNTDISDYIADPTNCPEWRDEVITSERITPPDVLKGSKLKEKVRTPTGSEATTLEITAAEPGKMLGFKTTISSLKIVGAITLVRLAEGTEVTYSLSYTAPFGLGMFADAVAKPFIIDVVTKSLAKMKAAMETARV